MEGLKVSVKSNEASELLAKEVLVIENSPSKRFTCNSQKDRCLSVGEVGPVDSAGERGVMTNAPAPR